MASIGLQSMGHDPQLLSQRLGSFVRAQTDAKTLARVVPCDVRTAENMRSGRHWPTARHWAGLLTAFGSDITEAVFHPDAAAARLEQEVIRLEQELAARRAALRSVAGALPRRSQAVAQVSDRSAEAMRGGRPSQSRSLLSG